MHGDFLIFGSSRIHYYRWGKGEKILLCFHGYGESASSFSFLAAALGEDFTILAIDLPFHGDTEWKAGTHFDPARLLDIIALVLAASSIRNGPWWLLGYSMGGRIALSLLEKTPQNIARLILLAPDGLTVNPWYYLATQTGPGKRLFRFTMDHPQWFFGMLYLGNALKIVNPSVYKFTTHYIGHRQVRQDLYTRWTTLHSFRPDTRHIRDIIRERQIPVRLLYGRFDRIIRQPAGERFRVGIEDYARITILPAGHQLLQPAHLPAILAAIDAGYSKGAAPSALP